MSEVEDIEYPVPKLTREQPFRGLMSYQDLPEDQALMGGREEDVEELFELIRYNVLVTFYGFSGTGKTSVLNAGLLPELRRNKYIPIYIRLNFQSEVRLSDQVKYMIESNVEWMQHAKSRFVTFEDHDKETLWEYFIRYSMAGNPNNANGSYTRVGHIPILIFDQFEEIFTLSRESTHSKEELDDLISELKWLIENQIPPESKKRIEQDETFNCATAQNFRVLFSIREDYLSKLNRLKDRIYSLDKAKYGLSDLKASEVKMIIDRTQQHFGIKYFDDAGIDYLIRQLNRFSESNEESIDPLAMSLLLYQLNEGRRKRSASSIPLSVLQGTELEKVMGDYYKNAICKFRKRVRKNIEDSLINSVGNRLLIPEDTLLLNGLQKKGNTRAGVQLQGAAV